MEIQNLKSKIRNRPGFFKVVRRELHIIAHSPFYYLFTFILPLLSFGVLVVMFYQESPRDMPILVCDNDDSTLSRELTRMIDASPSLAVAGAVHDMEEAANRIRKGEAYAVLLIPKDLEHDVKRGEAPTVTIYYNNQWLLVSGLISRAARDVVVTLSAGLDVRFRMMQGESPYGALQKYEPIRADVHLLFNPNLNYRYFLLPGLLANFIAVFVTMVSVRAIGGELKHGTAADWLAASGDRPFTALVAKLLPHTFFFLILSLFMFALLMRYLGVPQYGSLWVLLLGTLLFIISYQSMSLLLVVFTANLRLANSLAGFYTGPALAFGGLTYPYIAMPTVAKVYSCSIPLTHYLVILLQQSLRGAPPQASANAMLAIFLFAAIPPVLCMRRLGKVMRDEKYWGKL